MAEQLGAKEATADATEQSADGQKQVSRFSLPTRYCPVGTQACMHARAHTRTHSARTSCRLLPSSCGQTPHRPSRPFLELFSRAASRVSSGDWGEANVTGCERHRRQVTPHSPGRAKLPAMGARPAKPLLPLSSRRFQVVSGGLHPLPLMSLGSPTFWLGDAG